MTKSLFYARTWLWFTFSPAKLGTYKPIDDNKNTPVLCMNITLIPLQPSISGTPFITSVIEPVGQSSHVVAFTQYLSLPHGLQFVIPSSDVKPGGHFAGKKKHFGKLITPTKY